MNSDFTEQQSLQGAQDLIFYSLSCVAYIREFFPEEVFSEVRYGEMTLKKIQKGIRPSADTMLDWILRGCHDALKYKYLETITLGIFLNLEHPDQIVESYTLKFSYPNSEEHEMVRQSRSICTGVEIKTNGGESREISALSQGSFKQQIVRMLRVLCIMVQTLAPLPEKKYVSMQLTYYDELTPNNYEPPGFTATIFELAYAFTKPTFKQVFGTVNSEFHRVQFSLETTKANDEGAAAVDRPSTVPVAKDAMVDAKVEARVDEIQETIVPDKKPPTEQEKIRCLCGDSDSDLDMIRCDKCKTWQHTPCAGYCTNRDQRIPENYVCYNCTYSKNKKLLKNLQDLASFRRAISVVFSEGLESISWLSKRLDCGVAKASKLIRRLESEGLVTKPNSQAKSHCYIVQKTPHAKERIRYFFGTDLSVFPELREFFAMEATKKFGNTNNDDNDNGKGLTKKPIKRRRSETFSKITCEC